MKCYKVSYCQGRAFGAMCASRSGHQPAATSPPTRSRVTWAAKTAKTGQDGNGLLRSHL